jgi:flagellar hook protein FlgE
MSLYGLLTTGASGMAAQSALLGTVANNIANVNTTGYKDVSSEFASLVLSGGSSGFQSGSVTATTLNAIGKQGAITSTASPTDLAIQGTGFFCVRTPEGTNVLTRAGSFTVDTDGYLVNAAGDKLLGRSGSGLPLSGLGQGDLIKVSKQMSGNPSTTGKFYANLPAGATAVAATSLPSASTTTGTPPVTTPNYTTSAAFANSNKTSIVAFDSQGSQVNLDVYTTLVAPTAPSTTPTNTWEVDVFQAPASPAVAPPYATAPLATQTLTFNPANGKLAATSPTSITVSVTGAGGATMTLPLDMSQMTQLAAGYTLSAASTDGNAPSEVANVSVAADGTVSAIYQNGNKSTVGTIAFATVRDPGAMTVVSGNAFAPNPADCLIGQAGSGKGGSIQSNALESSTVDLSAELTKMITAQSNYQANSKVFQTGSTLLEVLVNLVK